MFPVVKVARYCTKLLIESIKLSMIGVGWRHL